MVATFLSKFSIALIIFLVLLLILRRRILAHPVLLVLFFGAFFLDNFLVVLSNALPSLQLIPNTVWEGFLVCCWSGKLYSIFAMGILLYLLREKLSREEVGLKLRQNPGSLLPAGIVVLLLSAWAFWIGASSPKGSLDLPTLAYLATLPGLNEELVYRGILLALLVKLIPGDVKLLGIPFSWGILLSSLLFGLLHGFWLDDHLAHHLDRFAIVNSTFSGLIFAWLRAKTGSLALPVVAHGLEDFLFFLPRMI